MIVSRSVGRGTFACAAVVPWILCSQAAGAATQQEVQASPSIAPAAPVQVTQVPAPEHTTQPDNQPDAGVEDIVVTAQRRSERQQDVPIAISTVTAATAERQGVIGTEGLGIAVPSLQFSRQTGNGGTPFLRGVGSTQATVGAESPVAVYVDDVYIGAPSATLLQFNNIDSTEVLKGPQGTLFGRNATGGVVNIHTKKPSHDFAIDALAGGGSYSTYYGSAYVNGGLTDNVAFNLAASGRNQEDGYGINLVNGRRTLKGYDYGVRGQLLWEPDSATSLLVSADWSRNRSDFGQSVVLAPNTVATGGGTFKDKFGTYDTPADFSRNTVWGLSAKLQHGFGAFSAVSITGYRHVDQLVNLDVDGSPVGAQIIALLPDVALTRTFSQEFQLVSEPHGPFRWIVGAFYYRAIARLDPVRFFGSAFAPFGGFYDIYDRQRLSSIAGFGEASYEFAANTKLTVGFRWTKDSFNLNAVQLNAAGVNLSNTPFEQNSSFPKATYRAILNHNFTRDVMVYTSYSRGFKSGGYNLSAPTVGSGAARAPAPVVSPEVLDAYEIGVKSEFLDHKVRLNVAVFHYDYSNLQVTSIQNSAAITLNAASSKVDGADIDFNVVPSHRFQFGGGLSFLRSRFDRFPNGPLFVPNPAVCLPTPATTGPRTGGNTTCTADLSGNYTSRAPRFTGSVSATYTLPTNIGDFAATTSLYHNSGFFWEPDNRYRQPSYELLSASLAWKVPGGKYDIRVYGKNMLNAYYYSYFSEASGRDSGSPEMPGNYGVEVRARF